MANKCLYSFLLIASAISKITAQEPAIHRYEVELIPAQNNRLTASDTQQFQKARPTAEKKHPSTNNRGEQRISQILADKSFLALSAGVYAGAMLDMYSTEKTKQWYSFSDPPTKLSAHFSDADPLARPFVNLPAPAYYASGLAFATGLNLVAWKLKHSSHFQKVWWIPQTISVSVNVSSGIRNIRERNDEINDWKTNNPHR